MTGAKTVLVKKFEQGCLEFEKDMFSGRSSCCCPKLTSEGGSSDLDPDGYGIYQDSTTFPYDITLARANLLTNKNERFVLKVRYLGPSFSLHPHQFPLLSTPSLTSSRSSTPPTPSPNSSAPQPNTPLQVSAQR